MAVYLWKAEIRYGDYLSRLENEGTLAALEAAVIGETLVFLAPHPGIVTDLQQQHA